MQLKKVGYLKGEKVVLDLKSNGLCPCRFKSCSVRKVFVRMSHKKFFDVLY